MKKLRIALLIDAWFPFRGGAQVHVREITKRLQTKCQFTIFHSRSAHVISRLFWCIAVIPQVMWAHSRKPFDAIHAQAYAAGSPGKILSKLLHIPVVYTVHGSNMLDLRPLATQQRSSSIRIPWWKYRLEKWLLTEIRYDREITVSQHFRSHENSNRNITYIPNGIDIQAFHNNRIVKKHRFTLLFVGRDDPLKGQEILGSAMERVHQQYPDIDLVKITQELDEKNIIRAYLSSHVFVLPSLSEGMPLTLLEAWAARLPVIATDVGDNSRLVNDGVNGFLVPPADVEALVTAILKAYHSPDLAKMGQAGYNLVKKNYSWEKAAMATLHVYKEVTRVTR
jgi:glycosyltransferase involved in cell wall biosynthesis